MPEVSAEVLVLEERLAHFKDECEGNKRMAMRIGSIFMSALIVILSWIGAQLFALNAQNEVRVMQVGRLETDIRDTRIAIQDIAGKLDATIKNRQRQQPD